MVIFKLILTSTFVVNVKSVFCALKDLIIYIHKYVLYGRCTGLNDN